MFEYSQVTIDLYATFSLLKMNRNCKTFIKTGPLDSYG